MPAIYGWRSQSLADKYGIEVWIGDDFGMQEGMSELTPVAANLTHIKTMGRGIVQLYEQ